MRAPLSWIREFTPVAAAPAEIGEALDGLGFEVEGIEEPGRDIAGVVVGRIVDVVPHPDADRIRLADVEYGDGTTRVVCGAPNIYPGMVAPFAPVGARLPGDFVIERRRIRGVVSEGMLCSARELGLGDDHAGILELSADAAVGADVREALGLDDVVFELSITPDRPDAMGIVGVARELAAHFGLPLQVPETEPAPKVGELEGATVVVEAPDRCPRFVAMVAHVTIGLSPAWLQRRLTLAGMRPISNVVDATNYVMLERCRPQHAFDLGRLGGRGIVVRLAEPGERIVTLDGVERALTGDDLLICDAHRHPQGIAGIMGGADAEVSDATTEILLESAYFEPTGIARSAKRLGLRSEASARFERGVDPNNAGTGAHAALDLLARIGAARVVPGAVDVYPVPVEPARIAVRTARVNAVLGTELSSEELRALVEPLGIVADDAGATGGDSFTVRVPTWRPDVTREVDVAEEVARRYGLDRIRRTVPANPAKIGSLTATQRARRTVVDVLVGAGYDEVYTLPLVAPADLARAGLAPAAVVEVENPLRAEESVLRPSVRPGLLRAAAFNAAHGEPDIALFETGTVFAPPRDAGASPLPGERSQLGLLRAGSVRRAPHEPDRPAAVHDLVAVVEALAQELRLADWSLAAASAPGLHPGAAAQVLVDGRAVGVVGTVAPAIVESLELVAPVHVAELDLDALVAGTRLPRAYRPVSRYPASAIDLAFVVPDTVPAAAVRATLAAAGGELLERVELFDVFRSEALGPDRKSLAFTLRFRAPDRTLTDETVGQLRAACIAAVVDAHGAELRG